MSTEETPKPKKDKKPVLNYQLDQDLYDKGQALADKKKISYAGLMRMLLAEAIALDEKNK